jgi:hypothetical protein
MTAYVSVEINLECRTTPTFIATRVTWNKVCYVPYNVIDHYPAVLFTRMLLDLLYSNYGFRHVVNLDV